MPRSSLIYCTLALLLFALLSYTATLTKSPTYDESEHTLSSYIALRDGNFSVEPDHPPLWKYWAALPLLFSHPPLNPRLDHPAFRTAPAHLTDILPWSIVTLYRTPGNNPIRAINSARFMMLLIAIALGITIALFSHRVAGPLAACISVTFFALDPNFLAHSSLVKNDVAITFTLTALIYTLYLLGQRITLLRILSLLLFCAACVTTKLTGILAAPIILTLLFTRALLPTPWPRSSSLHSSFIIHHSSFFSRLLTALTLSILCLLTTYLAIWAVYCFRFNPSPDPNVHYNTSNILSYEAYVETATRAFAEGRPHFDPSELKSWNPGLGVFSVLFALDHHLLPESFLTGLLSAHAASGFHITYLLDQCYSGSKWYYFPLAFLVKTPLTTLIVLLFSLIAFFASPFASFPPSQSLSTSPLWLPLSLLIPFFLILLSITTSGVNIGLRHIFPLYPLLYVALAISLVRLYPQYPKLLRLLLPALALALLFESTSIYPNFIPFFNIAAGGSQGGLHLLGDSNLDWGQDLPLLAQWQRANPTRTLHLAYFGLADPVYYSIHYQNLPNGYHFGPESPTTFPTTGVLAISASILQGLNNPDPHDSTYSHFLHTPPTQILGGSIYLFDLDYPPSKL